jgi:hypothetical protein
MHWSASSHRHVTAKAVKTGFTYRVYKHVGNTEKDVMLV